MARISQRSSSVKLMTLSLSLFSLFLTHAIYDNHLDESDLSIVKTRVLLGIDSAPAITAANEPESPSNTSDTLQIQPSNISLAGVPRSSQRASNSIRPVQPIFGVGTDNQVYVKPGLTSAWIRANGNCCLKSIYVCPHGLYVGVGTDNMLRWKETYSLASPWWSAGSTTCCMRDVDLLWDGNFVGVGNDKKLYTRQSIAPESWVAVGSNSCCVNGITVMWDGSLLGASTNGQLVTRGSLTSSWVTVPNSCCVTDVAQMPDGSILGVGTDGVLRQKSTLQTPWVTVPASTVRLQAVAVPPLPALLAAGSDGKLYSRAFLSAAWDPVFDNTCCIRSVTLLGDGSLLAVGTDKKLYRRGSLYAPWTAVGGSTGCCFLDIDQLQDGSFVAVGQDFKVYKKASLTAAAVLASPNSCCVRSLTVLQDGKVLAVGVDNQTLYYTGSLAGSWRWTAAGNSNVKPVFDVAQQPGGVILGLGQGGKLYQRAALSAAWSEVRYQYQQGGTTMLGFTMYA